MRAHSGRGRAQIAALLTHTVLVQAVTFVLRPTSTYRAIELHVPALWLGLLSASFAAAPLLLAVPAGHAADRFGERRVLVAGSVLLCASAATFLVLGHTVTGLLAASVILGTGHLCAVVGQQALVANDSPAHRYDTTFGHYTFAASLGQAVGPALIIMFGGDRTVPHTGAIFTATALLTAVPLAVALLLRPAERPSTAPAVERPGVRDLLRRPGLLRVLTVSCVVLAAVDITLAYLPALGVERGITSGAVGVLLALRAAASMMSRLFLGRLAGTLGRRRLLVGSIGLSAASLAVAAAPMPLWTLAVVVAAAGLGLGVGQPLTMSWLAESSPPGLRGRAMSLRLIGNRFGQVLLPGAAGLLAAGTGAGGVLALTAAGLAAVGVAARRLH
ncbi:MFS transporter [Dactylosporangium sp. AC04546]|uniref:MFS transporter n=1 Tax=Dactylosporangium sp. AC04546 TaxID=2862460 RepID=UPI001EDFF0E4|nr:MFS transporter [Dactylosporangium sp. AC04546]WVK80702.1 MFS transporter [Dactylosporangium sp. AC04546]